MATHTEQCTIKLVYSRTVLRSLNIQTQYLVKSKTLTILLTVLKTNIKVITRITNFSRLAFS